MALSAVIGVYTPRLGEALNNVSGDQPYAPPKSGRAARTELSGHELKKTPVLVVILFTVLSLGLYVPIWFLRRRKAFNELAPENDSVNFVTFGLTGLFVVSFVLGLVQGVLQELGTLTEGFQSLVRIVDLAARLFVLVASFRVKTILEGHYPERLSAVGTFFLTIFYLQYRINRAGQTDPVAEQFTLR